jgi:hypothetical protein
MHATRGLLSRGGSKGLTLAGFPCHKRKKKKKKKLLIAFLAKREEQKFVKVVWDIRLSEHNDGHFFDAIIRSSLPSLLLVYWEHFL